METDYSRIAILCFVSALICFGLVAANIVGIIPVFSVVIFQFIASRVILKNGATAEAHKKARMAVIRQNPSFTWKVLGLSLGVPVIIGLLAFYVGKFGFDRVLLVFLGTSYVMQIAINRMIFPKMKLVVAETFD